MVLRLMLMMLAIGWLRFILQYERMVLRDSLFLHQQNRLQLNEANDRELPALKAVIKSIEEHKLEEQYPIDPLQRRILQLEKAKADKKRVAEAAKPQSKRPRASGVSYGPCVSTSIPEKCFYRTPERYPYMYDRPYMYAPENHGSPLMAPAAPYNLSPNHGGFYGNGHQHATPYIH